MDSRLYIAQIPAGSTVASPADCDAGATNASLLDAHMLSMKYPKIRTAPEEVISAGQE